MVWKASPGVLTREVDGELVLLDLDRGIYFGLNEAGRKIWSELLAGRTEEEVAAKLATEFDAAIATIRSDVADLREQLVASGLLMKEEESPE